MSSLLTASFFENLLISTIRMMAPLLLVAIGELYSERAGLTNIGLDGLMTMGACFGFLAGYASGNPWVGVLVGAVAGIGLNLIYAFCTITLRVGQIITGMVLNILAPAITVFITRTIFGNSGTLVSGPNMANVSVPLLDQIPFIGPILFSAPPLAYIAVFSVIATKWFFARTKAGLNLQAIGEYPKAAETMGIHVYQQKYVACIICGALSGIGGAYLTTSYLSTYSEGVVAGRGFIALSAVIFGGWSAPGILVATFIFGLADALQIRLQTTLPQIPYQFFAMLPYVFTLVALFFAQDKYKGPKANGKSYSREEK